MTRPTDEILMAYADDALPAAEAARIGALIDTDAEARALVESFRRTAILARAAFADVMTEPVPNTIVRTVIGSEPGRDTIGPSHRRRRAPSRAVALPLAASLVLLAGIGAAILMLRSPTTFSAPAIALGPVPPATPLAELLEAHPSGVAVDNRNGEGADRLMVVATFRDQAGRACREVEVLDTAMQPRAAGVACRDPERGTWIVEGAARVVAAAPAEGTQFAPSGAQEKDALEGLLDMLGAERALTAEEERALLAKGWR